jgi:hypothetical protein
MNHSARRINALATIMPAERYLEIGVSTGTTFLDVDIPRRTGVDPAFAFDYEAAANRETLLLQQTSDSFFAVQPKLSVYDVVFIDGLHTFEQVVRDFNNTILHTHRKSIVILDDTFPDDAYSAHPDLGAVRRYRKSIGSGAASWHGDIFKAVFYLHDFWPALNYRTIVGSGNAQTIVWWGKKSGRVPWLNNLEKISRLNYFDLLDNMDVLHPSSEEDVIQLVSDELKI